jgi:DNA (cytosine-5)-methyltransferase 1
LMGVPEDYPIPASANDACHLFGDGVAAPVVRYLSEQVLERLG